MPNQGSTLYPSFEQLQLERRGRALWVTLTHPPVNAASATLHHELSLLLALINQDVDTKVIVLTGAGTAFCGGGDITEMRSLARDLDHHMRMFSDGASIIHSLLALQKPVVGRINGHAVGFGATLALLCDITVAVEHAKIGDPHVRVGLAAGDGAALIWPFLVGFARAREYLLTGKLMRASEAAAMGLINYSVPVAELDAKVGEFVRYFESGPALAISLTKRALNQFLQQYASTAVEAHFGLEGRTVFSADHDEAVSAFLEKREAQFK